MRLFAVPLIFFTLVSFAGAQPDGAFRLYKKKDYQGTLKALEGADKEKQAGLSHLTGLALLKLGKTEEAKRYFEAAAADPLTGDASLFQLIQIADSRGEYRDVLIQTGNLIERFPYSPYQNEALIFRARGFWETGLYLKAEGILTYLLNRGLTSPQKALWLLAKTRESAGKIPDAFQTYKTIYLEHPQAPFSDNATAEMERIQKENKIKFPPLTRAERIKRAELMMTNRMFKEAAEYIPGINTSGLTKAQRSALLLSLGNAYLKLGQTDKAMETLKISAELKDKATRPDALYNMAKIYWNRDDDENTRLFCGHIIGEFPQTEQAAQAMYILARMDESKGLKAEAVQKYEKLQSVRPSAKVAEESLFRAAFLRYVGGDFSGAEKVFERLADRRDNSAPAARYWLISSLRAQGKNTDGIQNLQTSKLPPTYYDYLTANPDIFRASNPQNVPDAELGAVVSERVEALAKNRLKEPRLDDRARWLLNSARAWRAAGFDDTAKSLLATMAGAIPVDSSRWMAWEFYKAGCNSCATKILDGLKLDDSPPEDAELNMLMLYPIVQWDALLKEALSAGVDPFLVLSVIRQESRFDPDALSPANAHGLMQLIPSTAERVGSRLGMTGINTERLRDPEINLRLGTQYLAELIRSENGSLPLALGTYNAGPKFMEKIKRRIPTDDPGLFIEQIPYQETKDYVKKVLRNYQTYKKLYGSLSPSPSAQSAP